MRRIYREIMILRQLDHVNVIKIVHLQKPTDYNKYSEVRAFVLMRA